MQIDDCWNKIGIWAKDGSTCPRLDEAVHCRNCAVYCEAGRILLDREIPRNTRQEWVEQYARPVERDRLPDTSFTVFRIGEEWLAIPTKAVKCIEEPAPIRRIPHRRDPVLRGVANLSGDLEPVISLSALIGIDSASRREAQTRGPSIPRMLRAIGDNGTFAFEADEVLGLHRHDADRLEPVSSTLEKATPRYVHGTMEVADRRVGVLDLRLVAHRLEQSLK